MSNVKALFFWRKFLSPVDIGPKKEKHGRKSWEGMGDKTPEYGVGALTQSVPQDFQKILLRVHQNRSFQAEKFIYGQGA